MKIPRVDIVSAHWKLELNITSCFSFCEAAIFVHILTLLINGFFFIYFKILKNRGNMFLKNFQYFYCHPSYFSLCVWWASEFNYVSPFSQIRGYHDLTFYSVGKDVSHVFFWYVQFYQFCVCFSCVFYKFAKNFVSLSLIFNGGRFYISKISLTHISLWLLGEWTQSMSY